MRGERIFALAFAGLLFPGIAGAIQLSGNVISSGCDPVSASAYRLVGTAGQPAVGVVAASNYVLTSGAWSFGGWRTVDVEPSPLPELPGVLSMGAPAPNPMVGGVKWTLALPSAARIDCAVFDARGREVAVVERSVRPPGYHVMGWNGRDAGGNRTGPGIYFLRMRVDGAVLANARIAVVP